MIQVKNLNMIHRKDLRQLTRNFSCVLNDGDKAVIIGEEGNGKSTLLRWIYDPKLTEGYVEAQGERIVNREILGYLLQELPEEERERTVYEFFMQEPRFFERTPGELGELARKVHVFTEFFYRDQKMGTLSGGEKVKAQMLRLLMAEPTVLLLDEPSNDIDIETLEWLEKLINEWPHIVIYISHDEVLIENTASMVIHMEQLRHKTECRCTVSHVPYRQYMQERRDFLDSQRRQAINDRREKKLREEKYQRIYQSVEYAQNAISRQNPSGGRLLKKKMHAVKSMKRRFEREEEDMTQMPEEESAIFFKLGGESRVMPAGKTVVEYSLDRLYTPDGARILSSDIYLSVRGPEKVCIVGGNGAGKTTLLKKIAWELSAREDIHAEYMPQNYEELLELELTPIDYLARTGDKEERTRIRTFLASMKYTADETDHPIAELSGGQKAKVLLMKMSISGANVLILDEPTRNFSPMSGPVIRRMLADFPGAIISISHDRRYINEVCTAVYRLTETGLEKLNF